MFRRGEDKDYYAILQVDPRAEPEVIEAAYRRLSRKYHPDVSGEADAGRRMRELNEAYETLSDSARRRAYDRRRSVGLGPSAPLRFPNAPQVLRFLLPSLVVAMLGLLAVRLLPILLRPPLVIALALTLLAYALLRRFRRR